MWTLLSGSDGGGSVTVVETHATESAVILLGACAMLFFVILCIAFLHARELHYVRFMPESALFVVLGTLTGLILWLARVEGDFFQFNTELFFEVFIPPIVFEAGYHVSKESFMHNVGLILLLAVPGTLLNTLSTGGFLHLIVDSFGFTADTYDLLTFGAIVSAVDPVAVLAVFHEVHVNETLEITVFGESVLNDAMSIVLYRLFLSMRSLEGTSFHAEHFFLAIAKLLVVSGGGTIVGVVVAIVCSWATKYTASFPIFEPLLVLVMSQIAYLSAEVLGLSGIVSVLLCGFTMSRYLEANVSRKSHTAIKYMIRMFAYATETLVFIYLGVSVFVTPHDHEFDSVLVFATVGVTFVTRAIFTFSLVWLNNRYRLRGRRISFKDQMIMVYGGLRGAIAFALALSLPVDMPGRNAFITATLFLCLFTIFVQGITIRPLINWLHIRLASVEENDRNRRSMARRVIVRSLETISEGMNVMAHTTKSSMRVLWHRIDSAVQKLVMRDLHVEEMELLNALEKVRQADAMDAYVESRSATATPRASLSLTPFAQTPEGGTPPDGASTDASYEGEDDGGEHARPRDASGPLSQTLASYARGHAHEQHTRAGPAQGRQPAADRASEFDILRAAQRAVTEMAEERRRVSEARRPASAQEAHLAVPEGVAGGADGARADASPGGQRPATQTSSPPRAGALPSKKPPKLILSPVRRTREEIKPPPSLVLSHGAKLEYGANDADRDSIAGDLAKESKRYSRLVQGLDLDIENERCRSGSLSNTMELTRSISDLYHSSGPEGSDGGEFSMDRAYETIREYMNHPRVNLARVVGEHDRKEIQRHVNRSHAQRSGRVLLRGAARAAESDEEEGDEADDEAPRRPVRGRRGSLTHGVGPGGGPHGHARSRGRGRHRSNSGHGPVLFGARTRRAESIFGAPADFAANARAMHSGGPSSSTHGSRASSATSINARDLTEALFHAADPGPAIRSARAVARHQHPAHAAAAAIVRRRRTSSRHFSKAASAMRGTSGSAAPVDSFDEHHRHLAQLSDRGGSRRHHGRNRPDDVELAMLRLQQHVEKTEGRQEKTRPSALAPVVEDGEDDTSVTRSQRNALSSPESSAVQAEALSSEAIRSAASDASASSSESSSGGGTTSGVGGAPARSSRSRRRPDRGVIDSSWDSNEPSRASHQRRRRRSVELSTYCELADADDPRAPADMRPRSRSAGDADKEAAEEARAQERRRRSRPPSPAHEPKGGPLSGPQADGAFLGPAAVSDDLDRSGSASRMARVLGAALSPHSRPSPRNRTVSPGKGREAEPTPFTDANPLIGPHRVGEATSSSSGDDSSSADEQ